MKRTLLLGSLLGTGLLVAGCKVTVVDDGIGGAGGATSSTSGKTTSSGMTTTSSGMTTTSSGMTTTSSGMTTTSSGMTTTSSGMSSTSSGMGSSSSGMGSSSSGMSSSSSAMMANCSTLPCSDNDMNDTNDCLSCSQTIGACAMASQTCGSNAQCGALITCLDNCPADNPMTATDENLNCICTNDGTNCTANQMAGTCVGDHQAGVNDYVALVDCVLGDAMAPGDCYQTCNAPPPSACNPVTKTGCDAAAGEACDLGQNGYECFPPPPPNTAALCTACGQSSFCAPGMTCTYVNAAQTSRQCVRFCCTDADCGGAAGSCDTSIIGDGVGLCAVDHMTYVTPVCSGIPANPPSMGSCVP